MSSQPWHENNLEFFSDRTLSIDMTEKYELFLPLMPKEGHILEAGCGPGRDVKYFLSEGFEVTAYDASPSMVKYASELTEQDILQMEHNELDYKKLFYGIWRSASFVHLSFKELKHIFPLFIDALKEKGAWFISLFTNLTPLKIWRSCSARKGSKNTWISLILVKKSK